MKKTQTAVPMLKAALEQAKAALAALPENADIKSSAENLAVVADRQEKSIVTMAEQVTAMDTSMANAKTEMEAAAKAVVTATETMKNAEKTMQTVTAEVPAIEAVVNSTMAELTPAEQAVVAAATVVENRRQQLRPQLQLTSAN